MAILNSYTHTQSVPSALWVVTHNLNLASPVVSVNVLNNGQMEKIIPKDIRSTNANTVEIEFTNPWTGSVRIL